MRVHAPETTRFMNIQEHLSVFDRWLTGRIEEAHAGRKDLAFRDLAADRRLGEAPWEYSLLEPGARSPQGEGWSVYRLHGAWPEAAEPPSEPQGAEASGRRSLLGRITGALFGKDDPGRR
jgi:hypothetical protein